MSDTIYLTFEHDADHPETDEEWRAFFTKSNNLAFRHIQAMIDEAREEKIPPQMMAVLMFRTAIEGLKDNNWTREDVLRRAGMHFPQH